MRLENGFGGISHLGGNRRKPYRARVTTGWSEDGKQLYKTVGYYKTRKEALAGLLEYHNNPLVFDNKSITFAEVFERWSKTKYEDASKSSINLYNAAFMHLEPLHHIVFTNVRPDNIRACISNCDRGMSTKKSIKVLCKQLYDWAIENDLTDKNYATFVKIKEDEKTMEKQTERLPFTYDEIQTLWDNQGIEFVDTILILLYSGMRIEELLILKTENINLTERWLKTGVKTAAGKDRLIPINKSIFKLIENRYNPENEYLLMNSRGRKMQYGNYRRKKWDVIMEKLNMNHLPHDTRHTFTSEMNKKGIPELHAKRILGHSNKDVTEHYTHIIIQDLIKEIDKVDYK